MTFFYISLLILCWLLVCLVGHGYVNTVEQISWWLHQHARQVRAMHRRREKVVQERWLRALEQAEETGGE